MGCENLAGMKFAHLLVLKRDEMKKSTHSYWLCQCDCGTICSVAGTHLKTGHTKSCGCYRKRKQVHGWLDLTGKRYGRLQVLGPWEKHSPLLEVVKEGESSVEEGKLAAQGDLWFCQCAASIVSVRKKTCALEKPEAVAALGRNREKQICAIPSILQKIPVWSGSRAGKRQRTIPVDTGVYTGEKMENGAPASDSREKFITLAPLWTMRMQ